MPSCCAIFSNGIAANRVESAKTESGWGGGDGVGSVDQISAHNFGVLNGTQVAVPITVPVNVAGNSAALTVADSGPGVPAELQPRLFQPFSAGDVRGGSGLGLAICHEIVRALGGTISLDNREDHGKVRGLDATVRLPMAENG